MNIWNQIARDAAWTPAISASGRNSNRAQPNNHKIDFIEIGLTLLSAWKGMQHGLGKFLAIQVAS